MAAIRSRQIKTKTSAISRAVPAPDLQVIGAGFGRTGTLSLREALVRLGYGPCDHMSENFARPSRFMLWSQALERKQSGQPIDWRPVLTGYRAVVDWPGAFFWQELVNTHPHAKVILTVREPERWYASSRATIFRVRGYRERSRWLRGLHALLSTLVPPAHHVLRVVDGVIWDETFGGRFHDRDHALSVYEAHIAAVRAAVPPERLLVFDVREGWAPLCDFLETPIPAHEAFPHVNDAGAFQRTLHAQMVVGIARSAAVAAGVALTFILARLGLLFWLKSARG